MVPRHILDFRFVVEATRNEKIGNGFPPHIKASFGVRHCTFFLLKAHEGSHNLPASLDMRTSVGLVLLIEEAPHHSLFLKLDLLDIHRIFPLIINGFKF